MVGPLETGEVEEVDVPPEKIMVVTGPGSEELAPADAALIGKFADNIGYDVVVVPSWQPILF